MAKCLQIGDLIWAKHKDLPFWPGKIIEPPVDVKSPSEEKPHHYVQFFGSSNHGWILDENIFHQDDSMKESDSKEMSDLKKAIGATVSSSDNAKKDENVQYKLSKEKEDKTDKKSSYDVCKKNIKKVYRSVSVKKPAVGFQRKKKAPVQVQIKKPLFSSVDTTTDGAGSSVSYSKYQRVKTFADSMANVLPNIGYSSAADIPSCSSSYYQLHENINQPPATTFDLSVISQDLSKEESGECSKKIGFLGLGIMGQAMAKNLLNAGHHVTVWNQTPEEMDMFLEAGASKGQTPASVVRSCHITFCCLTDAEAVKDILFSNFGVLNGLDSSKNKGYVEMTTIDPETSQSVAIEIMSKGGRYIEAPINWSKKNAIEGTLSFLVAGDHALFCECQTYFHAMGQHAFYMSSEVGVASKMNLVRSMLHGTLYAALAEAMALVKDCELSEKDFLLILQHGSLNCEEFMDKTHAIIKHNYSANTPIEHIQKNLDLVLSLGDAAAQPLQTATAANELYVRAKHHKFANYDVSAVYEVTRLS